MVSSKNVIVGIIEFEVNVPILVIEIFVRNE